jgi:hypothetical protein
MNEEGDGAIRSGLVDRVRSLLLGLDRRDRLETAGELAGWLQRQTREQLDDIAREMLLRALRCAGDPVNYRILEGLHLGIALQEAGLMSDTDLDRVALSERLNDLSQVGLLSRDMVGDQVCATSLGNGVRALIERVAAASGGELLGGLST